MQQKNEWMNSIHHVSLMAPFWNLGKFRNRATICKSLKCRLVQRGVLNLVRNVRWCLRCAALLLLRVPFCCHGRWQTSRRFSFSLFLCVRTHVLTSLRRSSVPSKRQTFSTALNIHSWRCIHFWSVALHFFAVGAAHTAIINWRSVSPSHTTFITCYFSIMSPIQKIKMAWKAYKNKKRDEKLDKAYTLRRTKSFP